MILKILSSLGTNVKKIVRGLVPAMQHDRCVFDGTAKLPVIEQFQIIQSQEKLEALTEDSPFQTIKLSEITTSDITLEI